MLGNDAGLKIIKRSYSKKGVHNCVGCKHSKDGYCNKRHEWGFMVPKSACGR